MHLLFVSSLLPDEAPATGFEIANQAIVDEYRRQGVRVTLAGFSRPGARLPRPGEIRLGSLVVENSAATVGDKFAWLARALRNGLPVSAAKIAVLDRQHLTMRLAEAGPVDAVVLNSIQMPAAYPFLGAGKPTIFIAHNVEARTAAENAANADSLLTRGLYRREARLLGLAESRLCTQASVVHTLSRDDAAALNLAGSPRCHLLPLAIGRPPVADDGRRLYDIAMIGTWSWAPNRAGLDWFLTSVVPLLPTSLRIAIAGRFDGPAPSAPDNVQFLGRVPDAQAFVRGARVVALATRGGTGIQLKTIECLEEGMPAVATPAALRGIDQVPGNVSIACEPDDFARALTDMVAAERGGRVGRGSGLAFALSRKHSLSNAIRDGVNAVAACLAEPSPHVERRKWRRGGGAPAVRTAVWHGSH